MFAGDLSGILNSSAVSDDVSSITGRDEDEEVGEGDISMVQQPGMQGPVTRSTSLNSSYSTCNTSTPTASRYLNDSSMNTSSSAVKRKRGVSVIGSPADWAGVLMNNACMFGDDLNESSSNKRLNSSVSSATDVSSDLSQSMLFENENTHSSTPSMGNTNSNPNGNKTPALASRANGNAVKESTEAMNRSSNFFQSPSRMVTRQRAHANAH
jgi:hypothetical protein